MSVPISVCVPTYNGAKYLRECIESVLGQTFGDLELLIVDDCSTDGTLDIARSYGSRDVRVRVLKNDRNLGSAGVPNYNRCVQLAKGEWIKFVFQDDFLEPTCLAQMLSASRPTDQVIICRRQFQFAGEIDETTRANYLALPTLETVCPGASEITANTFCDLALRHVGINLVGEPTAVLLRRSVFGQFGDFDDRFVAMCDLEYWLRVLSHTGAIYLGDKLATFRVHRDSTSGVNRATRKYRASLDIVILLDKLLHDPSYASLRAAAKRHQPPLDLVEMAAEQARSAKWVAINAAKSRAINDPTLLDEWHRFIRHYPRVGDLIRTNVFRETLERYLLWRFRTAGRPVPKRDSC